MTATTAKISIESKRILCSDEVIQQLNTALKAAIPMKEAQVDGKWIWVPEEGKHVRIVPTVSIAMEVY